jgi:hypothetical protein
MQTNLLEVSDYCITNNKALDIVAAAVSFNRKYGTKQLAACVLKPTAFMLYVKGIEVLQKKELTQDEQQNITFEGVKVLKGSYAQFDFMRQEYIQNVVKSPVGKITWQA